MKKYQKVVLLFLVFIWVCLLCFWGFLKLKIKYGEKNIGYVYFVKSEENGEFLVKVKRPLPWRADTEDKLKILIKELLKGPAKSEKQAGIYTSIPVGVKLNKIEKKSDVVYIDFSQEIETGGGSHLMLTRLAQIVYTATQFPEIKKVKILMDGKEKEYFSSEGIMLDKPLSREDFEDIIKEE